MIVLVLDEDIDDAFVADLLEEAGFKVVNCRPGGSQVTLHPRSRLSQFNAGWPSEP
jgi:hypothetical protein